MNSFDALFSSTARSCGKAAKSLRSGCGMRDVLACRAAKVQNRMCRRLEKRMDRCPAAYEWRRMAIEANSGGEML